MIKRNNNILIIGGGILGECIITSLINSVKPINTNNNNNNDNDKLLKLKSNSINSLNSLNSSNSINQISNNSLNISIIDTNENRINYLNDKFNNNNNNNNNNLNLYNNFNDINNINYNNLILAVKPQNVKSVFNNNLFINNLLNKKNNNENLLLISIIAGLDINKIKKLSKNNIDLIVRTMPNTPSTIGEGITVYTYSKELENLNNNNDKDEINKQIKLILSGMGESIYTTVEDDLNKATALSGSGPAYVYLFQEALIDSGVHLGLSRDISKKLVEQTIYGSIKYSQLSDKPVQVLKTDIVSPGGTTSEALYQLEKANLRTAVSKAVYHAYKKSQKLSKS